MRYRSAGSITVSCGGQDEIRQGRNLPARARPIQPCRALKPTRAKSARHFLQVREWRVRYPRTGLCSVFDDAVKAAVDEEHGAFTRLAIAAVGLARAEPETGDIAQPPTDDAFDRLGHDGVAHADGIVEIGLQKRQYFGAVIFGKWLAGDAAIVGEGDRLAVIAGGTGRQHDRQQHHRHDFGRTSHANSSPAFRRLLDRSAREWNSQLGYPLTSLSKS